MACYYKRMPEVYNSYRTISVNAHYAPNRKQYMTEILYLAVIMLTYSLQVTYIYDTGHL